MPPRIVTYPGGFGEEGWGATNTFITVASFLVAVSVLISLYTLAVSWKPGEVAGDGPWGP
jgi:cytochrome c oxidase subunit I+III